MRKRILLISGIDPTGEAGLILDSVIASYCGLQPAGTPTALVAENALRVVRVYPVNDDQLTSLILSVLEEGPVSATKIGLLPETLAEPLRKLLVSRREEFGKVVLDPVLGSTSGYIFHHRVSGAYEDLMRLSDLITPNFQEAILITGRTVKDPYDLEGLYDDFLDRHIKNILITGIRLDSDKMRDLLLLEGKEHIYEHFVVPRKVRGTGCALSTCIACQLASGTGIRNAVEKGIAEVQKWINSSLPAAGDRFMIFPTG